MVENLVLLVDDEAKILSSLTRILFEMEICEVRTALSGLEGIEILKKTPNVMAIVSDYHMPGMDGINFLCAVQKIRPDATRIMLTGAAGLDMAINAVNLGQIFRFLLKPCSSETFIAAIKAGIRQYQLVTSERELLQKTLSGSIKLMMDILSALSPGASIQATRLRDLARRLALELQMENLWEVELAALLCRIGSVTVPPEVLEHWMQDQPLEYKELAMIRSIAQVGQQLVINIPRLENVALGIGCQDHHYTNREGILGILSGDQIPVIGRILKLVVDYDRFLEMTRTPQIAFQELLKQSEAYDPALLAIFHDRVLKIQDPSKPLAASPSEREVTIENLELGMILSRDVVDRHGRLVVSRGTVITEILRRRLLNYFWTRVIVDPTMVRS